MGQSQLQNLHNKTKNILSEHNDSSQQLTSRALLQQLLKQNDSVCNQFSSSDIEKHIEEYLKSLKKESQVKNKRRRSYQIIKDDKKGQEKKSEKQNISAVSGQPNQKTKWMENRMDVLEDVQQQIKANITELMVTKKVFKIRQTFRRLVLNLLGIDNLYLYIYHSRGALEFQDFRRNYITQVIESDRIKMAQKIVGLGYHPEDSLEVMEFFELEKQYEAKPELYNWNTTQENKGISLCYVWKRLQEAEKSAEIVENRVMQQVAKVALLSTMEEDDSVVQIYCKGLIQILQEFIGEWQRKTIEGLGCKGSSMQEAEKQLEQSDSQLLLRVRSYQQMQFQLLERTRMYKKYICEGDKALLEFDQRAQLCFLSCNFTHHLLSSLPQLWEQKQLFLQKIFPDHKPVSDFLKRAAKQKVRENKLYELDFQSKIRVNYNSQGEILRLHFIIQQLDSSSSSSSNYYTSSTKIVSSGSSSHPSAKSDQQEQVEEVRSRKPSNLVRHLEKDNPGITNQGWINLFIKDQALQQPRKNTYFKTKQIKSYDVKRSFSLSAEVLTESNSGEKKKLQGINTDSIDLDLLSLEDELLEPFVVKVFKRLEFFQGDHIDKQAFESFLGDIHRGYQLHNNPFHNFTHGVNVMHTCFLLCSSPRIRILFSPLKTFAIVFSGLCHDVGHTGFTNLFEIASQSKKAITYNDSSPLENFHAAFTFQILRRPQNSFLRLSAEQMKQFRQQVIKNILFTDIKQHFPLLQKFNKIIKEQMSPSDESLQTISSMIVHTADFGGSAKQFELCKAWSLRVNLQFSNQYKKQGELGLPQTPFMKDLTNITILSKNQGGFLKVIVYPLYQAMDDFCGNDARVRRLKEHIEDNIQRWESINQESLEKKDEKPEESKMKS